MEVRDALREPARIPALPPPRIRAHRIDAARCRPAEQFARQRRIRIAAATSPGRRGAMRYGTALPLARSKAFTTSSTL